MSRPQRPPNGSHPRQEYGAGEMYINKFEYVVIETIVLTYMAGCVHEGRERLNANVQRQDHQPPTLTMATSGHVTTHCHPALYTIMNTE